MEEIVIMAQVLLLKFVKILIWLTKKYRQNFTAQKIKRLR
jgi:hypothetical protein